MLWREAVEPREVGAVLRGRAAQALNLAPPLRAGDLQQSGLQPSETQLTDCQMGITIPPHAVIARVRGQSVPGMWHTAWHVVRAQKVSAIFIINQKGGRNISEMMQPYEHIQSFWIFPT